MNVRGSLCLATLALSSSAIAADLDAWYSMTLSGTPAGWQHVVQTTADGTVISDTNESMTLSRAGVVITVESRVRWEEDSAGVPRSMTWVQTLGGPPVTTTWTFTDSKVEISVHQDGRTQETVVSPPERAWMPPAAAHRFFSERASGGADQITYRVIIPDLGLSPVRKRMQRLGAGTLDLPGGPMAITRWSEETEGLPLEVEVWFDGTWTPVRSIVTAPFGRIVATIADEATATGRSPQAPPELFMRMFVEPKGTLGRQVEAKRAFLRLRRRDGDRLELPASGAQTLAGSSDGGLLLLVERTGGLPPLGGESDDPAFLRSSAMIDATDEAVLERRDAVILGMPGAGMAVRAEAMRKHVYRWIRTKGLSAAFATASETARSREGDCSEHAVLLAAMLRSDRIPARIASGLVWMDSTESFGWHMWTQALIGGQWIDLDATLPVAFTPGHVLVSTSALSTEDGLGQLMDLIDLLGNLDIDVVRVDR